MTYTVSEILNNHAGLRCGEVVATLSEVEKNGTKRKFLMLSFKDVDGDPAYVAISEPPKRGPIYARTANENGLLDMIKPIKVLNGGMMPKGVQLDQFTDMNAIGVAHEIQKIGNFNKTHATIVALLLADLIDVEDAQDLLASFTNIEAITLQGSDSGLYDIVDRSQLVTRKPRKKQEKPNFSLADPIEEEAEFAAHTAVIMDDVDEDELLLMGIGG